MKSGSCNSLLGAVVLAGALATAACSPGDGPNQDSLRAADQARSLLASPSTGDGKALYAACAACHGDGAQGNQNLGAPSLLLQSTDYLRRQLQSFRQGSRGSRADDSYGAQMRTIAATLADDEAIDGVLAHIDSLPDRNAATTLQGDARRGADYYSNLCGACHGPAAEGNALLSAPALAGVDDWYLLRQFQHFRNGLRGADEADKYAYQMGMMGGILPDDGVARDVVVYINSLAD